MSALLSLPEDHRSRLQSALRPGEVVRWAGVSQPARTEGVRRFAPWFQIAFGLGIVATGLVIRYYAHPDGDSLGYQFPLAFALIGGVAIVIGLIELLGPARRQARALAKVHAVTSKRVLSLDGDRLHAVEPRQLIYAFTVVHDGGGLGDLHVEVHAASGADDSEHELTFRGVADVAGALRAVQRLAAEHGVTLDDDDDDAEDDSVAQPVASRSQQ